MSFNVYRFSPSPVLHSAQFLSQDPLLNPHYHQHGLPKIPVTREELFVEKFLCILELLYLPVRS